MRASRTLSYTMADQQRMARAVHYFAWQARLVKPHLGRRVIEVGCGSGNFTRLLTDREAVLALDSDPDCIEANSRRVPEAQIRRMLCDAHDLETFAPAR